MQIVFGILHIQNQMQEVLVCSLYMKFRTNEHTLPVSPGDGEFDISGEQRYMAGI
jgi:hypothetical protein